MDFLDNDKNLENLSKEDLIKLIKKERFLKESEINSIYHNVKKYRNIFTGFLLISITLVILIYNNI